MESFNPVSKSIVGSQPSRAFALLMSGRRCLGSSSGSGSNRILLFEPVAFQNLLGALQYSELARVADVDGVVLLGPRQAQNAFDFIGDVTETARLGAVAINSKRFAQQGLLQEVGDHASVVQLQTRAIGVENTDNMRVHPVIPVVG